MVKNSPLKDNFKSAAGFADGGNVWIKPEDMSNNMTYAITINPESQPDYSTCNGFVDWWGEQVEKFNRLKGCKLTLFCETSQKGRMHFHGFIKIIKRVIFSMFDVPCLQKFFSTKMRYLGCVKSVEEYNLFDDYADWYAYCLKLQNDMQEYICGEFIPNIKNREIESFKCIRT